METIDGLGTNGASIVGTGVAFTVLAGVAVGLRFTSKRITDAPYGLDDWLLLLGYLIYIVAEVLVIRSDIVGREAASPSDPRYQTYLQYEYIYSIFFWPVIALAQCSLLLLYRRIFWASHFRITSLVLVGVVTAWFVTASVVEIGYAGYPISYYWGGNDDTTFNIRYLTFWLAMSILELVIDVIIMVLPMRQILQLQLSTRKKILLSFIFAMGGLVIITGIVRISIVYVPNGTDFDLTQGDIWLNVHLGASIISACLPTFRPLISRRSQLLWSTKSNLHNSNPLSSIRMKGRLRSQASCEKIYTGQHDGEHFANASRTSSPPAARMREENEAVGQAQAVGVLQTIDVV